MQQQNIPSQCAVRFAQADFAENVQIGTPAAAEGKIGEIEQIQLAEKR